MGSISSFSFEKGYGFIESTEFTENVYFHASELIPRFKMPQIGDKVKFLVVKKSGRNEAVRVTWFEEQTVIHLKNDNLKKVHRMANTNLFKETNVLKTAKKIKASSTGNEQSHFNLLIMIIPLLVVALGFGSHFGWQEYQAYIAQQRIKMDTFLQHHADEVVRQREIAEKVPGIVFSEKSVQALQKSN